VGFSRTSWPSSFIPQFTRLDKTAVHPRNQFIGGSPEVVSVLNFQLAPSMPIRMVVLPKIPANRFHAAQERGVSRVETQLLCNNAFPLAILNYGLCFAANLAQCVSKHQVADSILTIQAD
jgi:hypothetical protein